MVSSLKLKHRWFAGAMSVSGTDSPVPREEWLAGEEDWRFARPECGEVEYVQALQMVGLDMANRLPSSIKEHVVVPLGKEPTRNLFIARLNSQTNERTLKLSCIVRLRSRVRWYDLVIQFVEPLLKLSCVFKTSWLNHHQERSLWNHW